MRFASLVIVAALSIFALPLHSKEPVSAQEILDRALHYADLYNWHAAGPLFERAERMFRAAGDHRDELLRISVYCARRRRLPYRSVHNIWQIN